MRTEIRHAETAEAFHLEAPSEESRKPNVGDEISVPFDGVFGKLLPQTFRHTGIYVGKGWVVSKYLKRSEAESLLEGPGLIAVEPLEKWPDWKLERRGGRSAAAKALLMYELHVHRREEKYHLQSDNCLHFTHLCLAPGICD